MVIIGFYLILWKNVAASQVINISKIYLDFECTYCTHASINNIYMYKIYAEYTYLIQNV
jgi:hypothetical protein